MKKKEIALVLISLVLLLGSIFIIVKVFGIGVPKKPANNETPSSGQQEMITGKFDEDALKKVKSLKDYGEAELSDIGRVNPFGPLN